MTGCSTLRGLGPIVTVVISRGQPQLPEGIRLAGSLDEAIDFARRAGEDEAFVAGGGEIYRLALPLADRIYVTRLHAEVDGDTLFPELDHSQWRLVESEDREPDEPNAYPFSFLIYDRV